MKMNIEKEREAFEKAYSEAHKIYPSTLKKYADGSYYNGAVRAAFRWWIESAKRAKEKLEGCVVVPETLSLDLARKRAEYIYQGAKNYLAREYANLSAIEMQLFKERWIESKAVSLQTDYLLTLESARGGK